MKKFLVAVIFLVTAFIFSPQLMAQTAQLSSATFVVR